MSDRRPLALLFSCLLVLAACGGDDPVEPGDPPAGGIQATIPPEGATHAFITDDGIVVTVTFPAGAVQSPQAISITADTPSGDSWVNLTFAPEGLVLLEPAQVVLAAPEGVSTEDQVLHWGSREDPILLPTTRDDTGRSLTTSIRSFGIPGESIVVPGPGGSGGGSPAPGGFLGSAQGGGSPNNMNSQVQTCAQTVAQAQAAFDAFRASGDYEDAVESALASAETLQLQACFAESNAFIDMAKEAGCLALADVMQEAIDAPITAYGEFEAQLRPVFYWAGQMQTLDPDCAAVNRLPDFVDGQVDDFLAFFRARLVALQSNDSQAYYNLKMELAHIWHMWADSQTLGVSAANKVRDRGLFAAFDEMRIAAYSMAKNDGWQIPLSRLTALGMLSGRDIIGVPAPRPCDDYFSPPRCPNVPQVARFTDQDIFEDLQYAGLDLEVIGRRFDGSLGSRRFVGQSPGVFDAPTDRLPVFTRGEIWLQGKLPGFTCWNDIEGDREIEVYVNSNLVLTLRRPVGAAGYLGTDPEKIDAWSLVQSIGTVQDGSLSTLELKRKRTDCDEGLWGPAEFTLLEAEIEWKAPVVDVDFNVTSVVSPGEIVDVEVDVELEDETGDDERYPDIPVTVSVNGGTILGASSGVTDANGLFTVQVRAGSGVAAPGALGSAQETVLEISATSTCQEGTTGQGSETVTVRDALLRWTFDDDEEGWDKGFGTDWGRAEWRRGFLYLDGIGDSDDTPNAWFENTFTLPADARILRFDTSGHDRNQGTGYLRVVLEAGGQTHVLLPLEGMSTGPEGYDWVERSAPVQAWAGQEVTVRFELDDIDGGGNNQRVIDNVEIQK